MFSHFFWLCRDQTRFAWRVSTVRTNPRSTHLRSRTRPLLVVVVALLASSLATLAAVAGTATTAHACSIGGPFAEARPSTGLQPGQQVEIVGWDFNDVRFHEPVSTEPPHDQAAAGPPLLCDFDVVPMANIDVHWLGQNTSWLGNVSGPNFVLVVSVPNDAGPGPAWITAGPFEIAVTVGGSTDPAPSPCPFPESNGTQLAPQPGSVPGLQPVCPEPCVDYAHTADDGTVYDYQWDCPDPCSQTQVSPGDGDAAMAVWCPPPDPCPAYTAASSDTTQLPGWCPWPAPCPLFAVGPDDSGEKLTWCPPPCEFVGGDARVCPDPCRVAADHVLPCQAAPASESLTGPTAQAAPAADAPVGSPAGDTAMPDESAVDNNSTATQIVEMATVDPLPPRASNAAMNIVDLILDRIAHAVDAMRLPLFD